MLPAARYFRAIVSYFPTIWQYAHFDDAPHWQLLAPSRTALGFVSRIRNETVKK